jgi:hypothetical protein
MDGYIFLLSASARIKEQLKGEVRKTSPFFFLYREVDVFIRVAIIFYKAQFFESPKTCTSSSPGEFHPQALTDRYVTVSRHTAPASIHLETSRSQAYPEKSGSSQLTG